MHTIESSPVPSLEQLLGRSHALGRFIELLRLAPEGVEPVTASTLNRRAYEVTPELRPGLDSGVRRRKRTGLYASGATRLIDAYLRRGGLGIFTPSAERIIASNQCLPVGERLEVPADKQLSVVTMLDHEQCIVLYHVGTALGERIATGDLVPPDTSVPPTVVELVKAVQYATANDTCRLLIALTGLGDAHTTKPS